jgi:hypothetical protein
MSEYVTLAEALVAEISTELQRSQLVYKDEIQLHEQIAAVLDDGGYQYEREVRLADELGRIDFVVENCLGIEVKIKGARSDVYRQIRRYSNCPDLDAVLLVTTRSAHTGITAAMGRFEENGCPVFQVSLLEGGL